MFIKEITLQGFKSYKEKTAIKEIFNGLNVIVGRNGSGKSNIFAAVEFALTMESRYLKQEARTSMLFQGRSTNDPAYVEVVFDNSDRKLPIPEDTVIFRRVLAIKKEKFYVNGKELTNAKHFLEQAGFTNPYFIVKQGKVLDLALATDATRLKIIADVTGNSDYDEKIIHCHRSIETASTKTREINEMMEKLKGRKDELEEEVSGQVRFMKLDQAKRGIEFVLHERKMEEIKLKVAQVEEKRKAALVLQDPIRKEMETVLRDMQIIKQDIGAIEEKTRELEDLKKEYEASRNNISTTLTAKRQELADLQQQKQRKSDKASTMLQSKLDKISHAKEQLEQLEKEIADLKEPMNSWRYKKCELDGRLKEMQEKEFTKEICKNSQQFRKTLEQKLKEISRSLEDDKRILKTTVELEKGDREKLVEETEILKNLRATHDHCVQEIKQLNRVIDEGKSHECAMKTQLESTWREISETEQMLIQMRERMARVEDEYRRCHGQDVTVGWIGLRKILDDFKSAGHHPDVVNGYLGLVCENIQCDPKLDLAVDSAAGKKLLYHIVQTKRIAQIILQEFNARKLPGVINFIPLSGLKINPNSQAPDRLKGAKALISEIQFSETLLPVVQFIFGDTLLCDSLETAASMMRQYKVQCVTIDGEKISKVGVIKGGYVHRYPQTLELQRVKSRDKNQVDEISARKVFLDTNSNKLMEDYKKTKEKHEKLRLQKTKLAGKLDDMKGDIEKSEKKISVLTKQLAATESRMVNLKSTISTLEEKKKILGSDGSYESGRVKIKTLRDLRTATKEYNEAKKAYDVKCSEKLSVDARIQHLYKMYYNEIESSNSCEQESNQHETALLADLINSLSSQVSEAQTKIDLTHKQSASLQKQVTAKQKALDGLTDKETRLKSKLRNMCSDLESFATNHAHWTSLLQEKQEMGLKLGSVPLHLEKYEGMRDKELCQRLKKVNFKLKEQSNVGINQMAQQQFQELEENIKLFERRLEEYSQDKAQLATLLRDLQQRKGDAMLQNMRVLQEQFNEIFHEIVPRGTAELILYGPDITIDRTENVDRDELREMAGLNLFQGVKVSVNFVGEQLYNTRNLAQLSGGQKSIIALCLILAIQKIDPVPFYLFDEVDQALDPAYRSSVARVIGEMSESSQFICTTFRPEFIDVADKVYGVTYHNRCSRIQPIAASQGFDFVDEVASGTESSSAPVSSEDYLHNNSESVILQM